jgi:hypothetical protein
MGIDKWELTNMNNRSTIGFGICVVLSALGHGRHGLLVKLSSTAIRPLPLVSGYIQGEVWKREDGGGIAKLRCNGFHAEFYETFVAIHVDKSKEPTWTDNYVVTIPWSKVEHLTLLPPGKQR